MDFRTTLFATLGCALLNMPVPALAQQLSLTGASIDPLKTQNLCAQIGGRDVQPQLVINHTPVGGKRLRVRMYDVHNDGTVTEHNTVTVRSEADGTTPVNSGFRPPCNRTNGARNSSYRFDVTNGRQKMTVRWGDYDSTAKRIVR